jgi:hypothetical protein
MGNTTQMFCEVANVNYLMGKDSIDDEIAQYYIVSGGRFEPSRVESIIYERSGIINEEHRRNFQETTYTDEYYDSVGDDRIFLDNYPITEITSLYLWNGAEYILKTQGRDPNSDDYYINKANSGEVRFHSSPDAGFNKIKVTYKAGYASTAIPDYVAECCSKMVGIDLAVDLLLNEELTKDQIAKWKTLINIWQNRVEFLLNKYIRDKSLTAKYIGLRTDTTTTSDLSRLLGSDD